ncbi:hypothetical protein TWF718_002539 [Orbilia javanica]|uniref:Cas1p 10 TM acyl transferase domain-containing protein n=1 Tax=Orbilia javanica TaxID=47235 RepID=A0AAN8MG37_9PEZI
MDHQRPRRYKQVAQTAPRVPPRYLRSPGIELVDENDEEERAMTQAILSKILNISAVLGVLTLLFLTVERFSRVNGRDPYGCAAITNEGRWLEPYSNTTDPLRTWQPLGCLLHNYSKNDIITCLPKRRLLFVGDRGMQSLYHAAVDRLQPGTGSGELDKKFRSEGVDGVAVEFVWDPYLNSTRLAEELKPWDNGTVRPEFQTDGSYDPPALFIVGAGIEFAKRGFDENPLRAWREAIDRVANHMRWGDRSTFFGGKDMLMLAPVEQPAWEKLQIDVRKSFTPSVAIDTNKYLTSVAMVQGVDVVRAWKVSSDEKVDLVVSNHIYNKYHSKETKEDGIELLEEVASRRLDMVLGLRCNNVLKELGEKISSSCCVRPQKLSWFQNFMMVRGPLVVLVLRVGLWWYNPQLQNKQKTYLATFFHYFVPEKEVLRRFWRLALILALCIFADRSPIFFHMEQLWSPIKFRNALLLITTVGALTLRKPAINTTVRELDKRILTEWKGVALAIHLISLYLGGSTDFSTFALVFGSSVEWTISLLTTNYPRTGGLYFARKLAELNYVALPMVFTTGTNYVLYRVPALLSFWFAIIYMTTKVRFWKNKALEWYLGKVALSAILVTILFGRFGIHEVILRVLGTVCAIQWDSELVKEMVFKNMAAAYLGAGAGWAYVNLFLFSKGSQRAQHEHYAIYLASFIGGVYCLLKVQGFYWLDEWHNCTSVARIAGFAVIKLWIARGAVRQSEFFIWLGNIEAAVLGTMNHLWLAADGEAVLDLGFWGFNDIGVNWNWFFWTLVFGYLCWAIGDARETIVNWVLGFHAEPMNKSQDRKKTDADAVELTGRDSRGDVETGDPQQARPLPKGLFEQYTKDGVMRVVGVLIAAWILNWTT